MVAWDCGGRTERHDEVKAEGSEDDPILGKIFRCRRIPLPSPSSPLQPVSHPPAAPLPSLPCGSPPSPPPTRAILSPEQGNTHSLLKRIWESPPPFPPQPPHSARQRLPSAGPARDRARQRKPAPAPSAPPPAASRIARPARSAARHGGARASLGAVVRARCASRARGAGGPVQRAEAVHARLHGLGLRPAPPAAAAARTRLGRVTRTPVRVG
jgi:hypothetical protein